MTHKKLFDWVKIKHLLTEAEQEILEKEHRFAQAIHHYNHDRFHKAVPIFKNLAEEGHAMAQNFFGICYQDGLGIERDLAAAATWFSRAAMEELASAQYNLGLCFHKGLGVIQDLEKAIVMYTKAAEQGHIEAKNILNSLEITRGGGGGI